MSDFRQPPSGDTVPRIAHDAITILFKLGQVDLANALSLRYEAIMGHGDRQ